MISEIKEKLRELDTNVQTGIARKVGDSWNCLVIRKNSLRRDKNALGFTKNISVRIVREDEIEEGLEEKVIEKMKEIGFRQATDSAEYEYTIDSNEIVIEICSIQFYKAVKGC